MALPSRVACTRIRLPTIWVCLLRCFRSSKKNYQGDAFLASMWATFKTALIQSQRVLILGHSLNDVELVDEITSAFPEGQGVGITVRMDDDGSPRFDSQEHEALVIGRFARANRIPMNFGPAPAYYAPSLAEWRDSKALPPAGD